MKKIVSILLLIVVVVGCSYKNITSTTGHLNNIKKVSSLDPNITSRLNTFGINFYNEIYKDEENIFVSPLSLYLVLSMIYNGADGNTKTEMANVLNINDLSLTEINELNREMQYLLLGYEKTNFELANSIWIRDTFKEYVKNDFFERNNTYYGAMISYLDFNNKNSIDTINNWVNKNTKGRIKKAIEEKRIDPLTVMYLINTIYFKADWQNTFAKEDTKNEQFINSKGIKTVEMMNMTANLGYVENESLQAVLLPYQKDETAMFVILPKENKESTLNTELLTNLIDEMKNDSVSLRLSMPKVKMEYGQKLNDSLSNMGMKDAFSSDANFSNMVNNEINLYISEITQKTFLAIDEKGTEAAAMTKAGINYNSAPLYEYTMNVNRPFIVGIIDKKSEAILFLGKIFDPMV